MTEAEGRTAVIAEARTYIRTPWHHMADIRGVGVDCAMLVRRVYIDCGLVPDFDPRPYPQDWHLHRGEERFLEATFSTTRMRSPNHCLETSFCFSLAAYSRTPALSRARSR